MKGQVCTHAQSRLELTPQFKHYGCLRCVACNAFLGWCAKPRNQETRRLNAYRLARLSMIDAMTSWEKGFVRSVLQQKKASPRQQEIINRLSVQYLGIKAS